jgi:aspartyl aminopeptidase
VRALPPTDQREALTGRAGLEKAGFARLHERDSWVDQLKLGGKYFITRNQSSIIAFTVPPKLEASKPVGMSIVG